MSADHLLVCPICLIELLYIQFVLPNKLWPEDHRQGVDEICVDNVACLGSQFRAVITQGKVGIGTEGIVALWKRWCTEVR